MGGKVLVPTHEAVHKLVAARLAADAWACRRSCSRAPMPKRPTSSRRTSMKTTSRSSRASGHEGSTRPARGRPGHSRGLAYARVRRPVWCETGKPDLDFAKVCGSDPDKYPGKLLAYNCSPTFNWKKNLDDATIAKFQRELGAMGYKFQFITLAGFHSLNYSMFDLAHEYAARAHDRVRRGAGARVCSGEQGLHGDHAPAGSRHGLLRRSHQDDPGRPCVDHRDHGSTEEEQFFDKPKTELHVANG